MTPLETRITAVTVYLDRARVTRTGTTNVDAGTHTLAIEPLPRSLVENSVRVSGKGNTRLMGVETVTVYAAQPNEGEAQAAQTELERLQDQDRILADEESAWQQRLAVINSVGAQGGADFARSLSRGRLSLEQLTELLDYLSQSNEAGANVLRDLGVRRRTLAHEIEAAKQRAQQLQDGAAHEWRAARVNVEAIQSGEVEISLTYAVNGAQWESLYDARLENGKMDWTYLAQVRQSTGEDWLDADLTLSTATLSMGLDQPELDPWRIDVYHPPQPRPQVMRAAMPAATLAAAPEMAPPPAALMEKAVVDMAEVESGGPTVSYRIKTPRAIPSDGEPHQVTVASVNLDAALDYFAAPKVAENVFLRAKFKNDSPYVMLGGTVSLYHGADFVGQRELETIAPGQPVELFLGADERIHIERQEIERSVDKNLLGNTARTQLGYRIKIHNLLPDTARLTVLDQIPVSQHPDIKVKLRDATPRPSRQDVQGELTWELELKPQDKFEIVFSVTVEYPKDVRVAGL